MYGSDEEDEESSAAGASTSARSATPKERRERGNAGDDRPVMTRQSPPSPPTQTPLNQSQPPISSKAPQPSGPLHRKSPPAETRTPPMVPSEMHGTEVGQASTPGGPLPQSTPSHPKEPTTRPKSMVEASLKPSANPAATKPKNGAEVVDGHVPRNAAEHLSFQCHLAPRLSESSLQFHDIHWGYGGNGRPMLRKRVVKFCRLFRFNSLSSTTPSPAFSASRFQLELALIDQRPKTHQQIVSNTTSLPLALNIITANLIGRVASGLKAKSPAKTTLVRSNYTQLEVALRMSLRQSSSGAGWSEVGRLEISLLADEAKGLATSAGHRFHMFGELRLDFDVMPLTGRLVGEADSLPDVLLCDAEWIAMLAQYRQMLCEQLAWQAELPPPQKVWLCDPLLVSFPRMLDERPELVNAFRHMSETAHSQRGKNAHVSNTTFRTLYMSRIFPLLSVVDPGESKPLVGIGVIDPVVLMHEAIHRPLDIRRDYCGHLGGIHAID